MPAERFRPAVTDAALVERDGRHQPGAFAPDRAAGTRRRIRGLGLCSLLLALLVGCTSSTQLVVNDKASAAVKARSFKSYREVLLLPPKDDPRQVVPRAVGELQAMGFKVRVLDPNQPLEAAQGTAFVIGREGWLLTCAHVLGNHPQATVTIDGQRLLADVHQADRAADLALLKLREPLPASAAVLSFRASAVAYGLGEDVYTIGFPLSQLLGNSARMSKGLLSATAGLRDDPRQLQVSAEIQPGNSGGPLLDAQARVIGVVQQTLNPWRIAQSTGGALPQNINFAIKNEPVLQFVRRANPALFGTLAQGNGIGLARAAHAVAKVQAGIVASGAERRDQMIVRLNYVSTGDAWPRFRVFTLAAFDYETREALFVAGQGRDDPGSSEASVMDASFAQFRRALSLR